MEFRTRKPSFKKETLPRVRPCGNCGEEKLIVARGLCDKCRKQGERLEAKLITGPGNREKRISGHAALSKLERLLNDMGVLRSNRERILQEFLPFCGFSPDTQRLLLRDMVTPAHEMKEGTMYPVHPGSSLGSKESEVRVVEE